MTQHIRQVGAPLALAALFALSACTVKDPKSDNSLAVDSSLNKDLQLAGRDTAAQPQLRDVPATPAATTPAPVPMRTGTAPAPRPATTGRTTAPVRTPAPAPRATTPTTKTTASGNTVTKGSTAGAGGSVGTIASGTTLSLHSNARVCTNTYQVGQTFTATTTSAVTGSNGSTIPAGATVNLEVTQLKRSENVRDNIVMEFAVKSLTFGGRSYPLSASVGNAQIDRVRNESRQDDAKKVIGGAAIGAIAGQILGKNTKSTVIGAAAGAAAGAGAAAATSNFEGCLPDGGSLTVTLNSPVQVKLM